MTAGSSTGQLWSGRSKEKGKRKPCPPGGKRGPRTGGLLALGSALIAKWLQAGATEKLQWKVCGELARSVFSSLTLRQESRLCS